MANTQKRKLIVVRVGDQHVTMSVPQGVDHSTFSPEHLEQIARAYLAGIAVFPEDDDD